MNSSSFYAIIMAGGRGERFWPASTRAHPKQLLDLFGDTPLLTAAVRRIEPLIPRDRILIITSADLIDAVHKALPDFPVRNLIGEPCGRDTAAAIALGAALIRDRDPQAVFAVLTADHVIGRDEVFRQTLAQGMEYAAHHPALVTIGIPPRFPSTGFGYIRTGESAPIPGPIAFRRALQFVEKPDAETAGQYVASGVYFWNSGMFMWSMASIIAAFQSFRPPLAAMMDRLRGHCGDPDFSARLAAEYNRLEKISIDYAVMEKADNILMAECAFDWDDVGSWTSLINHFPADAARNVLVGSAAALDTADSIIVSPRHRTAVFGVQNLVVVQAPGVTLVCDRDKAQDLKRLLAFLRDQGWESCL